MTMNSNELLAIENLIGSLNSLKQTISSNKSAVIQFASNYVSEYHNTFNKLIQDHSNFHQQYENELNKFHKQLSFKLNELQLQQQRQQQQQQRLIQQQQEQQRQQREQREQQQREQQLREQQQREQQQREQLEREQLEREQQRHLATMTNTNGINYNNGYMVVDNAESSDTMDRRKVVEPQQDDDMDDGSQIVINQPQSQPQPQQQSQNQPTQTQNQPQQNQNQHQSVVQIEATQQKQSSVQQVATEANLNPNSNSASIVIPRKIAQENKNSNNKEKGAKSAFNGATATGTGTGTATATGTEEKSKEIYDVTKVYKYKYDADVIKFEEKFRNLGAKRTSTVMFVGNIPRKTIKKNGKTKVTDIKIAAIQFFVMKNLKITMRQVEEVQIKKGGRSNYALVRIRSDVPLEKIEKFISEINEKNKQEFEDNKKDSFLPSTKNKKGGDDKKQNQKQTGGTSWKRKIFLNLNNTSKYFETEEEMYNDPYARNTIFVRNFSILNEKCHRELTDEFLKFGELSRHIMIKTDYYNDPYAVITFNDINDAIYCCNSEIKFSGRWLEMKYDSRA